ncbi:heat-shock protein Hsp33 [Komagataeibacter xylinus]|uniref:Heat-shock protein Hsp33 n=1 Tax=Komagataeibacter xylinus TaxID=28448 RepID=A0A318PNW0_KOMXY|nr:Hsp33 family molecular chaperone HslO [Komagataeibacter xylinus]AZV38702.1 heat-shock protein Hsp33 [Komagataeibacter xylinus]PYD57287.1 heat-shock protein Hsp33 [Komagataeibacter xylinus]
MKRVCTMTSNISSPAFLDTSHPDTPDLVVPQGVVPFYLDNRPVRGRLVRPGVLTDMLLTRHDNPDCVLRLAGEALALVAALASALKFQGSFSLQAKGDGPLGLLLADCTDAGALRFHARSDDEAVAALLKANPNPTTSDLLGKGYIAFSVDQGPDTDIHQGIVEINGESLSEMATHYFATSEQHACWVKLFCDKTEAGWRAGALVMEKIAMGGGIESDVTPEEGDDAWETAITLATTLTAREVLDDRLGSADLLYRLFHAEGLITGQPRALAFGCRCSRARLSSLLETFPLDDLDHMAKDGTITMNCQFCNHDFHFQRSEISGKTA